MVLLTEEAKQLLRDPQISEELKKLILPEMLKSSDNNSRINPGIFWSGLGNSTVIVALIGILSVFANYLVTTRLNDQSASKETQITELKARLSQKEKQIENTNKLNEEDRNFSYKIIEKEMSRTSNTAERAEILYFLSSIGMLPGLDNKRLEEFAKRDIKYPEKVGIPAALGVDRPDYHVSLLSSSSGISPSALKLVNLAVGELNKNYLETDSPDNVKMYWSSIGGEFVTHFDVNVAWSAAFASWLIKESGAWPEFKPTPRNVAIWKQALDKGLAFQAADKTVRPGDLIFLLRTMGSGMTCDIEAIKQGLGESEFCPGTTGVIYSVNDNIVSAISGNSGNAVRLNDYDLSSPNIIGFARL